MNLDDLQKPMSAKTIATLLEKHYNWSLPTSKMTKSQSKKLLENVQTKLNNIRNSKHCHQAEKSQIYTALLLTEQFLNKRLNEGPYRDAFGAVTGTLGSDISQSASTIKQSLRSIPGANVSSPVSQMSLSDIIKSGAESVKIVKEKLTSEYIKILKDNELTDSQFRQFCNSFINTKNVNDIPEDKREDFFNAFSQIEFKVKRMQGKTIDLDQITNTLRSLGHTRTPRRQSPSPRPTNPTNPTSTGSATPRNATLESKGNKMRFSQFNAKKKIYESAMADAEVVLAAKDIADRFQDMVESLGKMVNEELPALTETIRDTMGAEQAEAFNTSASQTINSALENIRSSKQELDSAARTLAGEEQPSQQPMSPEGDFEAPGSEELDQIPASASGEEEEPLGRGKR